jgi:GH15 family glucan-1,4-alpha-glucosidase
MALRIEDYALIGDFYTAALVGRDGSIDWLCLPRFDSGACFAALLGKPEHGRWLIEPVGKVRRVTRQYRDSTLVLETTFETDDGAVSVVDCMPPRMREPALVRLVVGLRGRVPMRMQLVLRPDYGSITPWVRSTNRGLRAVAGPDTFLLDTPIELRGEDYTTVAEFEVAGGDEVPFVLAWQNLGEDDPEPFDAARTIRETEQWWRVWAGRCTYEGRWREAVVRSLVTLKALTYAPTGGIVAAVTTSLPEKIGGVRNWDYRYCWVRDASFTLFALLNNGYADEAIAWRLWLLRAVAGKPSQMNIMYGLAGERRLTETELDWLPGYENSKPVRVGNAAHKQFQLDVFGEVMAALHMATENGLPPEPDAWQVQLELLNFLEQGGWQQPDEGIWEVRGPRRHFTHSKVMAWVAVDRAIKQAGQLGVDAPLERWQSLRQKIHDEVCSRGYNEQRRTFVQYYGSDNLDASLLMIPMVGFLPGDDPRVRGTVEAIERELMVDGFVRRYPTTEDLDGLPPGEGAFLVCTFWLVDCYHIIGRTEDAERLFERLLALRNDVGLLSEEYDPRAERLVGNFPQAFSHVGLVNAARRLVHGQSPSHDDGI